MLGLGRSMHPSRIHLGILSGRSFITHQTSVKRPWEPDWVPVFWRLRFMWHGCDPQPMIHDTFETPASREPHTSHLSRSKVRLRKMDGATWRNAVALPCCAASLRASLPDPLSSGKNTWKARKFPSCKWLSRWWMDLLLLIPAGRFPFLPDSVEDYGRSGSKWKVGSVCKVWFLIEVCAHKCWLTGAPTHSLLTKKKW